MIVVDSVFRVLQNGIDMEGQMMNEIGEKRKVAMNQSARGKLAGHAVQGGIAKK